MLLDRSKPKTAATPCWLYETTTYGPCDRKWKRRSATHSHKIQTHASSSSSHACRFTNREHQSLCVRRLYQSQSDCQRLSKPHVWQEVAGMLNSQNSEFSKNEIQKTCSCRGPIDNSCLHCFRTTIMSLPALFHDCVQHASNFLPHVWLGQPLATVHGTGTLHIGTLRAQ